MRWQGGKYQAINQFIDTPNKIIIRHNILGYFIIINNNS